MTERRRIPRSEERQKQVSRKGGPKGERFIWQRNTTDARMLSQDRPGPREGLRWSPAVSNSTSIAVDSPNCPWAPSTTRGGPPAWGRPITTSRKRPRSSPVGTTSFNLIAAGAESKIATYRGQQRPQVVIRDLRRAPGGSTGLPEPSPSAQHQADPAGDHVVIAPRRPASWWQTGGPLPFVGSDTRPGRDPVFGWDDAPSRRMWTSKPRRHGLQVGSRPRQRLVGIRVKAQRLPSG